VAMNQFGNPKVIPKSNTQDHIFSNHLRTRVVAGIVPTVLGMVKDKFSRGVYVSPKCLAHLMYECTHTTRNGIRGTVVWHWLHCRGRDCVCLHVRSAFLDGCVPTKAYSLLKADVPFLIRDVIAPLCSFNDADQALWIEDPLEFVRQEYTAEGDSGANPQLSAKRMIGHMVKVGCSRCHVAVSER